MCEVSLKYLEFFELQVQTDRQTDAQGKTICLQTLMGGNIILKHIIQNDHQNLHNYIKGLTFDVQYLSIFSSYNSFTLSKITRQ